MSAEATRRNIATRDVGRRSERACRDRLLERVCGKRCRSGNRMRQQGMFESARTLLESLADASGYLG